MRPVSHASAIATCARAPTSWSCSSSARAHSSAVAVRVAATGSRRTSGASGSGASTAGAAAGGNSGAATAGSGAGAGSVGGASAGGAVGSVAATSASGRTISMPAALAMATRWNVSSTAKSIVPAGSASSRTPRPNRRSNTSRSPLRRTASPRRGANASAPTPGHRSWVASAPSATDTTEIRSSSPRCCASANERPSRTSCASIARTPGSPIDLRQASPIVRHRRSWPPCHASQRPSAIGSTSSPAGTSPFAPTSIGFAPCHTGRCGAVADCSRRPCGSR